MWGDIAIAGEILNQQYTKGTVKTAVSYSLVHAVISASFLFPLMQLYAGFRVYTETQTTKFP